MSTQHSILTQHNFLSGGGDMGTLVRSMDWSKTLLGDPDDWPQSLRTMVSVCLNSRFPILVWWGKDLVKLYNDAYRQMLGAKHPAAMGSKGKEVWPEIWHIIGPMLKAVLTTGEATWSENQLLLLERKGYLEECYFTYSYSPIHDESGGVGGVFTAVTETTEAVINGRHLHTLRDLAANISKSKTVPEIYEHALAVLNLNKADLPFAMMYEINVEGASANLVAATDFERPHAYVPEKIDFNHPGISASNLFKCVQTGESCFVNNIRERLGDMPQGQWKVPAEEAYIIPLKSGADQPYAVLVMGINPHRRFDETQRSFFHRIADNIAIEISNVRSYEKEVNFRKAVQYSQQQVYNLIMQAPVAMAVLKGPSFIVEVANEKALEFWGRSADMVLNQPLFKSFPDESGERFKEILMQVYITGEGFVTSEYAIDITRKGKTDPVNISFAIEPFRDPEQQKIIGVMLVATDVTELINSRKKIEQSEERLKLATHLTQLGTWEYRPLSGELNWSQECRNIYGLQGNRQVDMKVFGEQIYPADADRVNKAIALAMDPAVGGMYEIMYRILRLDDGAIRWIKTIGRVYFNSQQQAELFIGTVLDITEEKNYAEELELKVAARTRELQQRKDFIEIVLDSSLVLTAVFDPDTRILSFNKKCELVFGVSAAYAIGRLLNEVFPGIEGSLTYESLLKALKGEYIHISNYQSSVNNRFYESYFVPLRNEEDNIYAVLMTAHDITEIINSTQQLQHVNKELLKSNLDLEQFAYVASHDLQEPLRKIQLFTQLLTASLAENNAALLHIKKISASALRMSELIKSVLNYSRLSRTPEQMLPVDLNGIAEMLYTDFELIIAEKNAKITYETLPVVLGLSLQLTQLFSNLVSNALKFSKEAPVITISARPVPLHELATIPINNPGLHYTEIAVKDNGIGFDQVYTDRIFTIFQRLNQRSVYEGTGIGLALCKKIVENHQGYITAESQAGKGATFYIYLPVFGG